MEQAGRGRVAGKGEEWYGGSSGCVGLSSRLWIKVMSAQGVDKRTLVVSRGFGTVEV